MKKTSSFQNSLIWFGAAVSIAEILTDTYYAPLGITKGLLAIIEGHVICCAMFFFAGLIGGRTGRSAMGTVELSFGRIGCLFFAALNVLQLVGWTAIMIYDGALAVGGIFAIGRWGWCLVFGALIIVWIAVGVTDLGWINKITMAALFNLTLVLCKVIFFSGNAMVGIDGESLTFGAAVELAVAMPLSWLPLISDYTRDAEKPTQATWVSVLVYGAVSFWMYVIGMGAAIFTGEGDIALIMVKAGLGVAALLILILSTVTTLDMDAMHDDTTVVVARLRERCPVNVMIGPPESKDDDLSTMRLFFGKDGKHVVCGGTTANAVASYLGVKVHTLPGSGTEEVPPMSEIHGVDLTTEGVVTVNVTMQRIKDYLADGMYTLELARMKDGASKLALVLLEEATEVNVLFGNASNLAQQDTEFSFERKLQLVQELRNMLTLAGKTVKMSIC